MFSNDIDALKPEFAAQVNSARACRQLSQNNTQTSVTAARKVLASLS